MEAGWKILNAFYKDPEINKKYFAPREHNWDIYKAEYHYLTPMVSPVHMHTAMFI